MKVFISWSGERSRAAARELHEWLQLVMPTTIEPWMSDTDLDKGSRWAVGLGEGLEGMSAGISVLTPENLTSAWLNFEAGAIGKAFGEGRVMTFLIGVRPAGVPQPLAQFQATSRTREDVTKMITDLNKLTETPMKDHILAKQIQAWWPELDEKLTAIENNAPAGTPPKRSAHEMLEEVLTLLRDLSRQAGTLVVPGIPPVGAPPPSLADIQALYGTKPAPSSLIRRALTRRITPFAARAFKSILDDMGPQAIEKVAIYLSRDTQAVYIVSDLTFPAIIFNHIQIDATELGVRVTFLSTEEFRRAKKLERFIQLPRDMPIEQSDPDENSDPDDR